MENPWEKQSAKKEIKENKKANLVKSILAALPLMAAINSMPGTAEAASAEEKLNNNSKIEVIKRNEQQAIEFLGRLFNLPGQENAASPSQEEDMKKQVAKVLIQSYALKESRSGQVSPEDISKAVNELWNSVGPYADQICGDKNGEVSQEDMHALEKALGPSNPGLEVLDQMHTEYKDLGKMSEKN